MKSNKLSSTSLSRPNHHYLFGEKIDPYVFGALMAGAIWVISPYVGNHFLNKYSEKVSQSKLEEIVREEQRIQGLENIPNKIRVKFSSSPQGGTAMNFVDGEYVIMFDKNNYNRPVATHEVRHIKQQINRGSNEFDWCQYVFSDEPDAFFYTLYRIIKTKLGFD